MIKLEHLIEGKHYALAHNPTRPCLHWQIIILNNNDRERLLYMLTEYNESSFHPNGWFIVVHNSYDNIWEILEVPASKSCYGLFSED